MQLLTPLSVMRKDQYVPTVLVRSDTASFWSLYLPSSLAVLEVKLLLHHPLLYHLP